MACAPPTLKRRATPATWQAPSVQRSTSPVPWTAGEQATISRTPATLAGMAVMRMVDG